MSGAFFTSRKIFDSPIWKNVVDFRMFFLIYGNAVFDPRGINLGSIHLERGQWLRSTRNLIEDLAYIENRQVKKHSTSVINRCIKRLVDMQMICTKTTELGTVFTVINYDKYQVLDNYKKENLEHNLEHSGNSGGTVEEHSGNNNKKDKKDKKKEYTFEFESFWDTYPRRKEKAKAFKCWEARLKETGMTVDLLLQCTKNYAAEVKRKGTQEEYIKLPATFLGPNRPYEDYKNTKVTELKLKPPQNDFLAKIRKMEEEARASQSGS